MYTQCSQCETVFRLSADALRAAGGQVRCGRCGEFFNALARLAEDSTGFDTGESALDLEARADRILESAGVPQVARTVARDQEEYPPPGVEIAHLEVLDWSLDEVNRDRRGADVPAQPETAPEIDPSLEYSLPPGELDRIFVESKARAAKPPPQTPPQPVLQPVLQRHDPHVVPAPDPEPAPVPAAPLERRARFEIPEVSEDVRRDMLAGMQAGLEPASLLGRAPRNSGAQFAMWLAAAMAAALLLAAQIGYSHREWFVTAHPASANLAAYQLRGWGVTGDPDANGTLRVRASILNTAAQLQPFPLLRVTLADRFGKTLGARDFEPSEYLGKPTARLLAPGEQVDATLQILDPGKNAEGFEIDVCLRGADRHVACAADAAPQSRR